VTTLLIVSQPEEVRALVPWARTMADHSGSSLSIVLAQRKTGDTRLIALANGNDQQDDSELVTMCREILHSHDQSAVSEEDSESQQVQLYQLLGDDWQADVAGHLAELQPSLVIVPAPTISRDQKEADHWQTALPEQITCKVMLIQDDSGVYQQNVRLAVILQDDFDNEPVLEQAARLTAREGSPPATAIYVEPNIGDLAVSVGTKRLNRLLNDNLNRYEVEAFDQRVIVSGHLTDAVKQLDPKDFDLILTGASNLPTLRRFFAAGAAFDDPAVIPALVAVRPAETFSNRLLGRMGRMIRATVPQLTREQRVALVSRIQTSSQWDFDFVFLVSLSTLIACLGLAESSGAVIVGAMLVAPLMTPIAGVGLGVAHSNAFLTSVALRTSLRGFATAMVIGLLFGLMVQIFAGVGWLDPLLSSASDSKSVFPTEIESRTRPQFYDLLIALASGIAAAYAMGRTNLFAALPGVAIAAALVPPVATSGIALAHGEWLKGGGALLLFVTNMVTIILGTSLVFRAVGIQSQKEGQAAATWPRYSLLLLVCLSVLATFLMKLLR